MNKYYFLFLIWLLPGYFLFQGTYQVLVYNGLNTTYNTGESYVAEVIDFDVKQIAAQTNGYVVVRFDTREGENIQKHLALSVQMAQVIMQSEIIPIRYNEQSYSPVVMMPTYDLQRSVVAVNMAVTGFGFLVTLLVALFTSRFAMRKLRDGDEELEIENIDDEIIMSDA
ncbi:hypothetical protein BH23BAC3_BH23BAC3_11280 [soil metagenome]